MTYLRLHPTHIDLLKQLRAVYAAAFEDPEKYARVPSDAYLERVLADTKHVSLVALDETGRVVGGLTAYVLEKIEAEVCEVYLYDLAVEEAYRRQGIATQLIEELTRVARSAGASVVFVQADNVDAPAVALYTKLARSVETDVTHFDIGV